MSKIVQNSAPTVRIIDKVLCPICKTNNGCSVFSYSTPVGKGKIKTGKLTGESFTCKCGHSGERKYNIVQGE